MNTVVFRDFEERDIDFIYQCKNDEKLNALIVGQYHPFSHNEAVKWVHGCMGEHETYKFWAIATNDAQKRIIGWCSLAEAFCFGAPSLPDLSRLQQGLMEAFPYDLWEVE